MATLLRVRSPELTDLQKTIPTPFPTHQLIRIQNDFLDDLAVEQVDPQLDCQSSVAAVQHSCLITLANILSLSSPNPLSSSNGADIPLHQALAESPLSCLVNALRARDGYLDRHDLSSDDAALLVQLHELVDASVPSLSRRDAHLAQAIVALLIDLQQLPASLALASPQPVARSDPRQDDVNPSTGSPYATIASLQRQLSSLQPSVASTSSGSKLTPMESVQTALLWARIDEQLETVVSLCKARLSASPQDNLAGPSSSLVGQLAESSHGTKGYLSSVDDALPPEYDSEYHHHPNERPPSYVADGQLSTSTDDQVDEKRLAEQYPLEKVPSSSVCPAAAEMMVHPNTSSIDFDTITHAIERLYVAAPQLANQRVELRSDKIVQMEKAKEGKGKARTLVDVHDPELDNMLELLGRASSREIPDQSVVIDAHRTGREKGTADIEEQRGKYLEHLVHRTNAGRLHSQDAAPTLGRSYSSGAGTGLQDTLEEEDLDIEPEGKCTRDGKRASYPSAPKPCSMLELPTERLRSRSVSAPHLAWLRPKDKSGNGTSARDGLASLTRTLSSDTKGLSGRTMSVRNLSGRLRGASKSRPPSTGAEGVNFGALDLAYVAEHHETLKHVLLFITPASPLGSMPSGVPLAEVLPSTSSGTYGDCLFLRLAGTPSPPLALPVPVVPGSKSVLGRSSHWEVKATCYQNGSSPKESEDVALLPASELVSLSPSSFTCASCTLPLVPAPPLRYRDLPSEHWEELIDVWMCHPEGQTLAKIGMQGNDDAKGGFGFWPTKDEALVGGSYVLFDADAVAGGNIKCMGGRERGGNTRLARCLCGAILGRQHDRKQEGGLVSRMYRLFKYAIRPISATTQVPRIPMSAFVLRDMLEHVQAHATYRFVLSDEEDEKPRLLIWLFKPRMRLSYMLPTPALLPKSGTIDASKVLYKILGPTSATSDFKEMLNKYPGFPQAEYLFYPMDVCCKLAALLTESTASYPESMRTMTGLDVGWLTMM